MPVFSTSAQRYNYAAILWENEALHLVTGTYITVMQKDDVFWLTSLL